MLDDVFHELKDDLEKEANDYHLNLFYLNFEDEIQEHRSQCSAASKSISKHIHFSFYEIPDYLSSSNLSFQATFFSELRSYFNPIDFTDLQQLSILTHQMSIIHLHQQLWHRCLQSGTSQLKPRDQLLLQHHADEILSFWPDMVISVMISKGLIDINRQNNIDQNVYINFIQKYLQQLEKKVNQCRFEFDTIKNRVPSYTHALNDKIEQFVQKEGLQPIRLHFQTRMALIEYICFDRWYQWEYLQQKSTHLQV